VTSIHNKTIEDMTNIFLNVKDYQYLVDIMKLSNNSELLTENNILKIYTTMGYIKDSIIYKLDNSLKDKMKNPFYIDYVSSHVVINYVCDSGTDFSFIFPPDVLYKISNSAISRIIDIPRSEWTTEYFSVIFNILSGVYILYGDVFDNLYNYQKITDKIFFHMISMILDIRTTMCNRFYADYSKHFVENCSE